MAKTVALILDPNFGDRILSLAQQMPVWIVASPVNDRAVAALRSKFEDERLTTLLRLPNERSDDTLARALIAIDEHHGGEGQTDSYEVVEAYGAKELPSHELSSELGFRSLVATDYGFRAQKQ
jgi:hypothetical protein